MNPDTQKALSELAYHSRVINLRDAAESALLALDTFAAMYRHHMTCQLYSARSNLRDALERLESQDADSETLDQCHHFNAVPSVRVPGMSCPDCGAVFRNCEQGRYKHEIDDDGVCKKCGFDAAEWWHLERMKEPDDRESQPPCE